jgi:hypothetical protein
MRHPRRGPASAVTSALLVLASTAVAAPAEGPFGPIEQHALLNAGTLNDAAIDRASPALPRPAWQGGPGDPAGDPQALKVIVDRDGPVLVTGADLAAAGWDLARVDPNGVSLESGGRPHAIAIRGTGDGRLDPADRIVFYGRAMTGEYTRENVYWLTPVGPAARMVARPGAPTGQATAITTYSETLHFEQDRVYYQSMHIRDGDDRWMWSGVISPGDRFEAPLAVTNLASGEQGARMRVRLQGYTDDAAVEPDHHARIRLGGQVVYDARFDAFGIHEFEFGVPPGALVEGDNALAVESVEVPGAAVDAFFVNWVDVTCRIGLRAVGDRVAFAAPAGGSYGFDLTGFARDDVTVLDVTDPAGAAEITGVVVAPEPGGSFGVHLADTAAGAARYVAFTPAGADPLRIEANLPSRWRSAENGADYIIVTHPLFAGAIRPLAERRADQGMRVAMVLIDDVYDEFAHGVFDPHAIRALLEFAFERWRRPAPSYVLLVGESNLDYRLGASPGPRNYVPSMQVDLDSGEAGTSDVWFAAVQGGVVPDMAIGRISVTSPQQVDTVVRKILTYPSGGADDPWRRRAILVADDTDAAVHEALNTDLARLLPTGHEARRFDAATYPRDRNLTADIAAAIHDGALALHFSGHANVDTWSPWPGGGRIFQNSDIAALANGDRLPIYTSASCMTGWISHNQKPVSMSEAWVNQPGGGGVAAWAESGLEPAAGQAAMIRAFYEGLYDGRARSIGALTVEAAMRTFAQRPDWADVVRQFVLVGDPALVVSGVPTGPTPVPTASPAPSSAIYLPRAVVGRSSG